MSRDCFEGGANEPFPNLAGLHSLSGCQRRQNYFHRNVGNLVFGIHRTNKYIYVVIKLLSIIVYIIILCQINI